MAGTGPRRPGVASAPTDTVTTDRWLFAKASSRVRAGGSGP